MAEPKVGDPATEAQSEREVWKPVPGYGDKYEVSNLGRLRSWMRPVDPANPPYVKGILRTRLDKGGYVEVKLTDNGKTRFVKLHRLVAAAFLGKRPKGFQVNHIDLDKENNRASNLEYVTPRYNSLHGARSRKPRGTSKYWGVHWCTATGKWRAQIMSRGKLTVIGDFHNEKEAAIAYDRLARQLHGSLALQNFKSKEADNA